MSLARFYPIFDHVDWLHRMLPLGVKLVQLRLKDMDETGVDLQLRQARDLCAQTGTTLVVNDYWRQAIDLKCDWLHLGQEDLDTADVPAIRKAGLKLGISTHDEEELDRARSLSADYIALGPVYPTILKKMKWHQQGLERVNQWKKIIGDTPLVGIGGMSVERAPGVFAAGADIVSVVTDITLNTNPETRLKQWVEATQ